MRCTLCASSALDLSGFSNIASACACYRAHPYCKADGRAITEQLSLEGGPCVGGVRRREKEPGGTHPCMRQERTHRQIAGHSFGVGGRGFWVGGESFVCSVQGGEQGTRGRGSVRGANLLRMEFFLRSCEKLCIARDQELLVPSHTTAEDFRNPREKIDRPASSLSGDASPAASAPPPYSCPAQGPLWSQRQPGALRSPLASSKTKG